MVYTQKIQKAIRFAIKTHEVDQKQKRKGKDIPYLTHPMTTGIILASAGLSEDIIIAGILHDTIEDSTENNKVTAEIITEMFGKNIANLVLSVTENDKHLAWEDRKREALDHIKNFSHDSVLIKSADIISNVSETEDDFYDDGNKVFERFAVSKDRTLENYKNVSNELLKQYPDSPLSSDLKNILSKIENIKDK